MKTLAKWSVADYHRMVETGILKDRQVELLAGEVIEMSPETPIHYTTAKRGAKYLESLLSDKADVRFNGPITLADSEPEPDIAIVRLPESAYCDRHPTPPDILFVVEVAKSSLQKDLAIKGTLYATADIKEYWILDLVAKQLIVLRNPQQGQYAEEKTLTTGTCTPVAFPNISVSVQRLLS